MPWKLCCQNPVIPWYIYCSYYNAEFASVGEGHCCQVLDWSAETACQPEVWFWVNQTILAHFYFIVTSLLLVMTAMAGRLTSRPCCCRTLRYCRKLPVQHPACLAWPSRSSPPAEAHREARSTRQSQKGEHRSSQSSKLEVRNYPRTLIKARTCPEVLVKDHWTKASVEA